MAETVGQTGGVLLSFAAAKAARDPHLSGLAICINCQRQWVAVAPVGTLWLECPQCTLMRGRYFGHTEIREGAHWTCACSCNLFFITPDWDVYCPNCGASQDFPDPPPINDFPAV